MGKLLAVSDKTFGKLVLKSKEPVLIDFWAPWCMPCQIMTPVVEKFVEEYRHIRFAEVNVDENPIIASGYGIAAIPTLLVFKDRKPIKQFVGVRPKSEIKEFLDDTSS